MKSVHRFGASGLANAVTVCVGCGEHLPGQSSSPAISFHPLTTSNGDIVSVATGIRLNSSSFHGEIGELVSYLPVVADMIV